MQTKPAASVRVHQGNRTNRIYVCLSIYKETNYEELAHMIIEADKFQGLPLARWRPRRAAGGVLV